MAKQGRRTITEAVRANLAVKGITATKKEVNAFYDALCAEVAASAAEGNTVMLDGIGSIKIKPLKARKMVTFGKEVNVGARTKLTLISKAAAV